MNHCFSLTVQFEDSGDFEHDKRAHHQDQHDNAVAQDFYACFYLVEH